MLLFMSYVLLIGELYTVPCSIQKVSARFSTYTRVFVMLYFGFRFHAYNILPKLRSFANFSPRLKAVSMSGCMTDVAGHVDGAPLEIMDDISSFLSTVFDLRFKPKQLPIMI